MDLQCQAHVNLWLKVWKKDCDLNVLRVLQNWILSEGPSKCMDPAALSGQINNDDQITEDLVQSEIENIDECIEAFERETNRVEFKYLPTYAVFSLYMWHNIYALLRETSPFSESDVFVNFLNQELYNITVTVKYVNKIAKREGLNFFAVPKIKLNEYFVRDYFPNYIPDEIIYDEIFEERSIIDVTYYATSIDNTIYQSIIQRFIYNYAFIESYSGTHPEDFVTEMRNHIISYEDSCEFLAEILNINDCTVPHRIEMFDFLIAAQNTIFTCSKLFKKKLSKLRISSYS